MIEGGRSRLKLIVSVALSMVPRQLRRRYSEKLNIISDPAKDEIAEGVAHSVSQSFDLTEKPVEYGPPLGSLRDSKGPKRPTENNE